MKSNVSSQKRSFSVTMCSSSLRFSREKLCLEFDERSGFTSLSPLNKITIGLHQAAISFHVIKCKMDTETLELKVWHL